MFIYVSGPYSAPPGTTGAERAAAIAANVDVANDVALELVRLGHVPFVPHTMMAGWEERYGVAREVAMEVCHRWVERCDAIYVIAPSPGADSELQAALAAGIEVFRALDEVPSAAVEREPV
jgi:hypothetical protein